MDKLLSFDHSCFHALLLNLVHPTDSRDNFFSLIFGQWVTQLNAESLKPGFDFTMRQPSVWRLDCKFRFASTMEISPIIVTHMVSGRFYFDFAGQHASGACCVVDGSFQVDNYVTAIKDFIRRGFPVNGICWLSDEPANIFQQTNSIGRSFGWRNRFHIWLSKGWGLDSQRWILINQAGWVGKITRFCPLPVWDIPAGSTKVWADCHQPGFSDIYNCSEPTRPPISRHGHLFPQSNQTIRARWIGWPVRAYVSIESLSNGRRCG